MKDPDVLIFSEILEYALSLVPVAKGQEPFHGIPIFKHIGSSKRSHWLKLGKSNLPIGKFLYIHETQGYANRFLDIVMLQLRA